MTLKSRLRELAVDCHERLGRHLSRPYHEYPFGHEPRADRATYLRLHAQARAVSYPEIDRIESKLGFAIDREWMEQLALHTQVVIKQSRLCYQHGRLIYAFLRHYLAKHDPQNVTIVETGTARGFSALCMARALADASVGGHVITLDVLPHDTPFYWNCIDDLERAKSRRELLADYGELSERVLFVQGDTLDSLRHLALPRVHFAFLDAQHTKPYVMAEFNAVEPRQRPGDLVFFDDYTPSSFPGVVAAVDTILEGGYSGEVYTGSDERAYVCAEKDAPPVRVS